LFSRYNWISPQLMDSHQKLKHKRLIAIAQLIRSRRVVNYKQFLGEMQFNGLRKTVAEEYLEALKDFGLIRFENDRIVWNDQDRKLQSRV
jgi:hypothetical protein